MAKKIIKRRKIKIFRLLLVILILGAIFLAIDIYLNTRIKNITIIGTSYLKDDYILSLANLDDYPSFYFTTSHEIKNKLEKSPYIKSVKVKKAFYHTLTLKITENEALFISETNHKVILENKEEVPVEEEIALFRVPRLMNYVPNTKYDSFKNHITKIDRSILGKVSEINKIK